MMAAGAAALRLWVTIWAWCYPLGREALDELLHAEAARGSRGMARAAVAAPQIARDQQAAESRPETRTGGRSAAAEPFLRAAAREALIWLTALLGAIALGAVVASFASTGNFLFEAPAHRFGDPDGAGREVVSPFFQVAALAVLIEISVLVPAALALDWSRRRHY